jgi:hypothetical protein
MLIVVSGLPGTGKTTIARTLAIEFAAVYLRIDSIEQAIRDTGRRVEGEGNSVAHAVAEDNLRLAASTSLTASTRGRSRAVGGEPLQTGRVCGRWTSRWCVQIPADICGARRRPRRISPATIADVAGRG